MNAYAMPLKEAWQLIEMTLFGISFLTDE